MYLSIDPGKLSIAMASFGRDKQLSWVDFLKFPLFEDLALWCAQRVHAYRFLVIERPQVYQYSSRGKKDPNDLIDVAQTVGVCRLLATSNIQVRPSQWKGQLPKKVSHARIKEVLSKEECTRLGKYSRHKDVLDAVGVGLRYLRRM